MTSNMPLRGLEQTTHRRIFRVVLCNSNAATDQIRQCRFGEKDDAPGKWERATWPYLKAIVDDYPEAGLHFRGKRV